MDGCSRLTRANDSSPTSTKTQAVTLKIIQTWAYASDTSKIFTSTPTQICLSSYRGLSDSEGIPTERGLQSDSEAILDWAIAYKNRKLVEENMSLKIFLLGRSLGGAVALYISTKATYSK